MRIEYLSLPAFGRFTEERIEFGSEPKLHLLFGRNEAGKSTLLRAILDVLFGIPQTSGDDFLHRSTTLRIEAGLQLADGSGLAFRRRKGRKNTILGLDDQPLPEDILAPYLAGLDRSRFEQMFGLDHLRLREGGRELLAAGGSLGESLFEAASGLHQLRKVMEELKREADSLFTPTSRTRELNNLAQAYQASKGEVTNHILSVQKFEELRQEYEEHRGRLVELEQARLQAERCKTQLQRLKNTKPQLLRREALIRELELLGELPRLAPERPARYRELAAALRENQEAKEKCLRQLEALEREISELEVPQVLLELEPTIDGLQRGLDQFRDVGEQLPALQNRIELLKAQALGQLRSLKPAAENLEAGETYRLPLTIRLYVGELADQGRKNQADLAKAQEALANGQRDLENTRRELAELGTLADTSALQKLLEEVRKKGDLDQLYRDTKLKLAQGRAALELKLESLPLWEKGLEDLAAAKLPLPATLGQFGQEWRELLEKKRLLEQERQRLTSRRRELEEELAELARSGEMPTEASLQEARARREEGWQLVLKSWLEQQPDREGEAAFSSEPLPKAYEASVERADQIADALRAESDRVARKEAGEKELAGLRAELEKNGAQLEVLRSKLEEWQGRWELLWEPLGIKPLSPEEMQEWRRSAQQIRDEYSKLQEGAAELALVEGEREQFSQRLQEELQDLGVSAGGTLAQLTSAADQFCRRRSEQKGRLDTLRQRLSAQEQALAQAREGEEQARKNWCAWQEKWVELLDKLGLPAETSPETALKFLEEVAKLIELLDELAEKEKLRDQQLAWYRGYRRRVEEAALQAGIPLTGENHSQVVELLVRKSREAAAAAAARAAKQKQLSTVQQEREELERELQAGEQELGELVAQAGVQSREELEEVLQRWEQAQQLREQLEEVERHLLQLGGGLSLGELVQEAEGKDAAEIGYELEKVEGELARISQELSEVNRQFGVIEKEYRERISGREAAAAEAAQEAQHQLTKLGGAVEKYLRLRTASLVLQRAMERYRDEHQDPVLSRAGELFRELTLGSFSGLAVDYDKNENPVIVGVRAGERVGVAGMSDGTQDQLYLALRLASIEQYLEEGEPMPLILDDILVNFDRYRSAAALKVLGELAEKTQVILFTHHLSLVELARATLPREILQLHFLGEEEVWRAGELAVEYAK